MIKKKDKLKLFYEENNLTRLNSESNKKSSEKPDTSESTCKSSDIKEKKLRKVIFISRTTL